MICNLCNQTKYSNTPWITFMTQSFFPLYSLCTFQTVHITFEALNTRSTCVLVEITLKVAAKGVHQTLGGMTTKQTYSN